MAAAKTKVKKRRLMPRVPPKPDTDNKRRDMRMASWIARAHPSHPLYDPKLEEKLKAAQEGAAEKIRQKKLGVPWGFTREDWDRRWKWRLRQADALVQHMEDTGMIETPEVSEDEALEKGYSRDAMKTAAAFVLEPALSAKDRLAAASLVLTYTRSKPVSKSAVAISTAEDFLKGIADEIG